MGIETTRTADTHRNSSARSATVTCLEAQQHNEEDNDILESETPHCTTLQDMAENDRRGGEVRTGQSTAASHTPCASCPRAGPAPLSPSSRWQLAGYRRHQSPSNTLIDRTDHPQTAGSTSRRCARWLAPRLLTRIQQTTVTTPQRWGAGGRGEVHRHQSPETGGTFGWSIVLANMMTLPSGCTLQCVIVQKSRAAMKTPGDLYFAYMT